MKKIAILGSTGSIGTQSLDLLESNPDFQIDYLCADRNYKLLYSQILKYKPKYACINNANSFNELKKINTSPTKLISGTFDVLDFIKSRKVDLAINSIVGISGLKPTLNIIESGTTLLGLANKESLVMAGEVVMKKAKSRNVDILPIDSEHSAIWQCLHGETLSDLKKIILTASGGPFRKLSKDQFKNITIKDALNHPNWNMGNKITIDSATMMNKGFEVIETKWLFNIDGKHIDILVHPQSIVHSMVEFQDTSIKAQLGYPDMKIPINYALNYPLHSKLDLPSLDLSKISKLTFQNPDFDKFRCIKLAYDSMESGGTSTSVLNIANDISVGLFLNKKISFIDIPEIIELCIEKHDYINNPSLEDILGQIDWVKNYINEWETKN